MARNCASGSDEIGMGPDERTDAEAGRRTPAPFSPQRPARTASAARFRPSAWSRRYQCVRAQAREMNRGCSLPDGLRLLLQPFKLTEEDVLDLAAVLTEEDVLDLAAVLPAGAVVFIAIGELPGGVPLRRRESPPNRERPRSVAARSTPLSIKPCINTGERGQRRARRCRRCPSDPPEPRFRRFFRHLKGVGAPPPEKRSVGVAS